MLILQHDLICRAVHEERVRGPFDLEHISKGSTRIDLDPMLKGVIEVELVIGLGNLRWIGFAYSL